MSLPLSVQARMIRSAVARRPVVQWLRPAALACHARHFTTRPSGSARSSEPGLLFNPYDPIYQQQPGQQATHAQRQSQPHTDTHSQSQSHTDSRTHTTTDTNTDDTGDAVREAILDRALTKVSELGWTVDAIRAALSEMNLSVGMVGMFQHGAYDLAIRHHQRTTERSLTALRELDRSSMTLRDQLREALLLQLREHQPIASTLPQMIGLSLLPTNLATTLLLIAEYIDNVYHECGDIATDTSWYTQRAELGAVYVSSVLFMSSDSSPQWRDTQGFIDRRFDDLSALKQATGECADVFEQYTTLLTRALGVRK